jgi:hypothetical protein
MQDLNRCNLKIRNRIEFRFFVVNLQSFSVHGLIDTAR